MHRVYNSAFMNMLRDEENAKYRSYLKKTVEFDPDILKRYVNFMSNPDERTAIDQFGSGDKYFGVSVLLATLPGLPMFGHGQVEGFTERYGMDFKQARLEEVPNEGLSARHQYLIAPLLKNRQLFAESTNFVLYDFWTDGGSVDENVFAYSNRHGEQRAIIFYNNSYESTRGTIHMSVGFLDKATGALQQRSLTDGLCLPEDSSVILAYRDAVLGLEYLRRAGSLQGHGLSLDLRGYQHVVLLNWRELQSSAAEPWDTLCDSLGGSGVQSVEEALSQLRLRPIVDALRQVVNQANIEAFVAMAAEKTVREQKPPILRTANVRGKKTAPALKLGSREETAPATVDQRSNEFVAQAHRLAETLMNLSQLKPAVPAAALSAASAKTDDSTASEPQPQSLADMVAGSISLPSLLPKFPEELKRGARAVLPIDDAEIKPAAVWAPVLAWLALSALPAWVPGVEIYDELHLRNALAETFSVVGIEGEARWRAAAQVRVLLKLEVASSSSAGIGSKEFWQDPDVGWLAGLSGVAGNAYFNQERLETLVCWLQLPALIRVTEGQFLPLRSEEKAAAVAVEVLTTAAKASYNVDHFLDVLTADRLEEDSSSGARPLKELADHRRA